MLLCGSLQAPAVERVISLAPNLTEIICAIGAADQLVGRTSACDYPPEPLKKVPVIGDFGVPSLEKLVVARPTLVVDVALEDEAIGRQIAKLGLRRERVACRTLDDIPVAIRRLGVLLHREASAEPLAKQIADGIAAARTNLVAQKKAPLVYAEFWSDPPMTCGKKTFLAELITLAGGRNLGDVSERDYYAISTEWLVARQPDIVLCFYMDDAQLLPERIDARAGWSVLPAVKHKKIYGGFDNNLLLRPGPRALEGLRVLQNCFTTAAQ
ncbi:MAG: helical backbone metal receptor [Kiritimatiellaeota bacterium]|nr:helical backbone metal receptor [Kiritimatiellota bacterium]